MDSNAHDEQNSSVSRSMPQGVAKVSKDDVSVNDAKQLRKSRGALKGVFTRRKN